MVLYGLWLVFQKSEISTQKVNMSSSAAESYFFSNFYFFRKFIFHFVKRLLISSLSNPGLFRFNGMSHLEPISIYSKGSVHGQPPCSKIHWNFQCFVHEKSNYWCKYHELFLCIQHSFINIYCLIIRLWLHFSRIQIVSYKSLWLAFSFMVGNWLFFLGKNCLFTG